MQFISQIKRHLNDLTFHIFKIFNLKDKQLFYLDFYYK